MVRAAFSEVSRLVILTGALIAFVVKSLLPSPFDGSTVGIVDGLSYGVLFGVSDVILLAILAFVRNHLFFILYGALLGSVVGYGVAMAAQGWPIVYVLGIVVTETALATLAYLLCYSLRSRRATRTP